MRCTPLPLMRCVWIIFVISAKPFKQFKSKPQTSARSAKAAAVQSFSSGPVRASVPALLGIEITRIQQRRLGKDDPSVLAANLAKRHTAQATPDLFRQRAQKLEKAVHHRNESAQRKTAAAPLRKEDLAKLLSDLFSNKR